MNLTLLGMSGVGKSVVGKALSEKINYKFIDIDEIIEKKYWLKLQQIIDKFGEEKLLSFEEKAVLDLGCIDNSVISPGGSIVYSKKAMDFLKKISKIVFLKDSVENIKKRIDNLENRGIVGLKNRDFHSLFKERESLYKKYADIIISVPKDFDVGVIVNYIIEKIL